MKMTIKCAGVVYEVAYGVPALTWGETKQDADWVRLCKQVTREAYFGVADNPNDYCPTYGDILYFYTNVERDKKVEIIFDDELKAYLELEQNTKKYNL